MNKTKKIIVYLIVVTLFLLAAAFFEQHTVFSLVPGNMAFKKIDGTSYTETASFDGLVRKDGKLYDGYSLTPELLQFKDCPT